MALLEFGVKNYHSFKEEASISLRLDANCPDSVSRGFDYSHVLCFKGANGSGKTQLLKAYSFMAVFCATSFTVDSDKTLAVEPFFYSKDPISFYAVFVINDIRYRYELTLTQNEILSERIYRTKGRQRLVMDRLGNTVVTAKPFPDFSHIKFRSTASFISTFNQHEFDSDVEELSSIYRHFKRTYSNVNYQGHSSGASMSDICEYLKVDADIFQQVKEFIYGCDVGICDIEIRSKADETGKKSSYPVFFHSYEKRRMEVPEYFESSGTRALLKLLTIYFVAFKTGGVLILDELDMNLHPLILPKLIEPFWDADLNPNNTQFIFSTHDSEILNLLGRYRTYLVTKEDNESFTYRLDEIPGDILRNDRPIRPVYNAGKIGGIPKL